MEEGQESEDGASVTWSSDGLPNFSNYPTVGPNNSISPLRDTAPIGRVDDVIKLNSCTLTNISVLCGTHRAVRLHKRYKTKIKDTKCQAKIESNDASLTNPILND